MMGEGDDVGMRGVDGDEIMWSFISMVVAVPGTCHCLRGFHGSMRSGALAVVRGSGVRRRSSLWREPNAAVRESGRYSGLGEVCCGARETGPPLVVPGTPPWEDPDAVFLTRARGLKRAP